MKTMLIRVTFLFVFILFLGYILNAKTIIRSQNYVLLMDNKLPISEEKNKKDKGIIKNKEEIKENVKNKQEIDSFYGTITGYTPDCSGCIGITASGYDVRSTIYYTDKEYGKIRVAAADKKYPFGTIIRLTNISGRDDIITIVLDRGSAIGNNKNSQLDLLFKNEYDAYNFGRIYNAKLEILRLGY